MKSAWLRGAKVAWAATASMLVSTAWANKSPPGRFDCGGAVEEQILSLWKSNVRTYLERSLRTRMLSDGDVYVLYDMQTYTHNLVAMARRCRRPDVLMDLVRITRGSFSALQTYGMLSTDRRWICRGGKTCTYKNGLLGEEVMLCSVQFLGLLTSLANALATSGRQLDDEQRTFTRNVSAIVEEHLRRWGDAKATSKLEALTAAKASATEDGSSKTLFTDRSLWMIAIYAEWAGMLDAPNAGLNDTRSRIDRNPEFRVHAASLLRLFKTRMVVRSASGTAGHTAPVADLDAGFWSHFADNRYAAYEGEQKPLACPATGSKAVGDAGGAGGSSIEKRLAPQVLVPAGADTKSADVGWDISHARRLVHALDALERNRAAMKRIFNLGEANLPASGIADAFAGSLLEKVWNGDRDRPLFRNYFNGANGWYRVGYSPTGGCTEGQPPYGLTDSFLTGGYASWGAQRPLVAELAYRLYDLSNSSNEADQAFVTRYYPQFGSTARPQNRALSHIMFLPSLVGIKNQ